MPIDNRTKEQKESMEKLVKSLHDDFPEAIIKGHHDFPNVYKACPSFCVETFLKEINL